MRNIAALALVLATTACVADVDTLPSADDAPPTLSEGGQANNKLTAFNFFVSKGLSKVQAAGIVGNLMQESSVSPTAVQYGGGPGRGIAQWSVGGRWDGGSHSLAAFAAANGESRWALDTQLNFIWHELTTEGYGYSELRAQTTIAGATIVFQDRYEICGTCVQSTRIQYAEQVYNAYAGGGGGGGGTGGAGTCYSHTLGKEMPDNACVQSKFDDKWYQCDNGAWVDRWSDPDPCNGEHPL